MPTKITQLEIIGNQIRPQELAINRYGEFNQYSAVNKDALSDGDEFGKGENNGNIGSKTDILTRITEVAINRYGPNNQYSVVNKDALSDGDEFGKGENNGSIGSQSDIINRNKELAINTYGTKHTYPDF